MTTFDRDPLFDPRISDWLEDDPDRSPDIVLETVTAAFRSIPQRRAARVPWRFPLMSMPARVAVAAVIGVLLVGGALFTLWPSGHASVGGPGPSLTVSPSPSPSPMSDAAFLAARNAICTDAAATLNPIKSRFGAFDASLTDSKRDTWAAALTEFHDGYDTMIARLAALPAPSAIAADHAKDVQDLRDQAALIATVATKLQARDDAAAQVADASSDPIGRRVVAWENLHGFVNCP
jgi:hypothetical protein